MYKLCKTEQSAARQKAIARALLAEMAARPYGEITITDLCCKLGMPRKTFYRYFDGKEDALHALLDDLLLNGSLYTSSAPDHPLDGVDVLEQYFRFWLQHKQLLDILQRNGLSGLLVERGTYLVNAQKLPLVTDHSLGPGQRMDRVALFAQAGLISLVLQWHHSGCTQSPRRMAQDVYTLLTSPLFAQP
ncbi:MAG: TetR family transcriptional regulator [Faecalibacterium sp.]|nr:TetR family transcriptional regulator [Faecalibacterium sp.]